MGRRQGDDPSPSVPKLLPGVEKEPLTAVFSLVDNLNGVTTSKGLLSVSVIFVGWKFTEALYYVVASTTACNAALLPQCRLSLLCDPLYSTLLFYSTRILLWCFSALSCVCKLL